MGSRHAKGSGRHPLPPVPGLAREIAYLVHRGGRPLGKYSGWRRGRRGSSDGEGIAELARVKEISRVDGGSTLVWVVFPAEDEPLNWTG